MALVMVRDQNFASINAFLDNASGLNLTLLAAGWTLLEEISAAAGAQDRVYYSAGESGDEAAYLRVTHESATFRVHFRAYSWWDDAASTGYNGIGDVAGNTCLQLLNGAFDVWITADADEVCFVADIGAATYSKFFAGVVTRREPSQRSELTTLVGPETDYNSQGDDRLRVVAGTDFTGLEVDQYLWLVNQHATGPAVTEQVEIQGTAAGSRIIYLKAALANSFVSGALVGTDPQPMVLWGDSDRDLTGATPKALHSASAYTSTDLETPVPAPESMVLGAAPLHRILFATSTGDYVPGIGSYFYLAPAGLTDEDELTDGSAVYDYFVDGTVGIALRVA